MDAIVFLTLFWLHQLMWVVASFETVYFDQYGHCLQTNKAFDVDRDTYILKSTGGNGVYENTECEMTFHSPSDREICLRFRMLKIKKCGVKLKIYRTKRSSGKPRSLSQEILTSLTCHDHRPSDMCTSSAYVTIVLSKEERTYNKGYSFEIYVGEKDTLMEIQIDTPIDTQSQSSSSVAFIACLVVGSIILSIGGLAVIMYFCYKCCGAAVMGQAKETNRSGERQAQRENFVQPSAPPMDDLPPPYMPPPSYEESRTARDPGEALYENTPMMNR
ncbi:cilia- and flagella-associated protein 54-like [Plakobranchus ocellatus]|uniref:Cilia- and flagella-associated protein 54-like n=1 Tax=Plakobranchus ocellatus TaxID=259542 RepID=A0AAV4DK72_9GAST|nr:cilia- and flagella-associated protein 54-like [Plakobranchus ocellatus]